MHAQVHAGSVPEVTVCRDPVDNRVGEVLYPSPSQRNERVHGARYYVQTRHTNAQLQRWGFPRAPEVRYR